MNEIVEPRRAGGFIATEANGTRSRGSGVLSDGQKVVAGQVLGQVIFADAVVVAAGGNTGDGTLSGVAYAAQTQAGDYILSCTAASADGGEFDVMAPNGDLLAPASVGVAYAGSEIAFTLNDGAVDFAVGDTFTITVGDGSGEYVALNAAATDGSQIGAAISVDNVDATTAAQPIAVIVRDAEVKSAMLVWPGGSGAANEVASAVDDLEKRGILLR